MKAKLIVAGVAILLAGLLLYLWKAGTGSLQDPSRQSSLNGTPSSETSGAHQAHSPEQSKAQPEATPSQDTEPPTIEIPAEKQQLIGVKVVEVSLKQLQKTIRTVGRIEYNERNIATVNTKVEGWIEKLYVDFTGRFVKKGEPLAEIYSPELLATQKEYLNLLRWSSKSKTGSTKSETEAMLSRDAEAIVDAAQERLKLWDVTDDQIRKIQENGKPIRTLTIHSPVNGYVIQKSALQGMRVMAGEKLFDVADLSSVWVISDIYEFELPLIHVGQKAKITLSYFPGREFPAMIDYLYPTLSGETRTAAIRFTIENPGGQLKPQMFTDVEVKVNLGKRIAIPEDAVIDAGTRQIVYVDKGEGYFEPRPVTLGVKADGMVEVLKGLRKGEKVASSANFLIDSEAKLKGIEQ